MRANTGRLERDKRNNYPAMVAAPGIVVASFSRHPIGIIRAVELQQPKITSDCPIIGGRKPGV